QLPALRPSAKVPDDVLEHLAALYQAWQGAVVTSTGDPARAANMRLRKEMRDRDNYFGEIETAASAALRAVEYPGYGPISERMLIDIAAHFGFTIDRVQDLPSSSRSITDLQDRVIYIPQRNEVTTRASRSVVLSTLGHFALDHRDPTSIEDYLRQRVESNYFAGAVLAPEAPLVQFLREAKQRSDISAEDVKDLFYVSYEMATHRITNLATRHLGLTVHFLRTDQDGVIWKAYENNGVPFPSHADGTLVGQRVPPTWGPRQAFSSDDTFADHPQYTETSAGTFWCVTHVETDQRPYNAITLGTTADQAHFFRGSDIERRLVSPDNDPQTAAREERIRNLTGRVWPSARDRKNVTAAVSDVHGRFSGYPGVDMDEVAEFLERRSP
ncbi:MAG: ImmA/IrrE family metallo-endopeptidase, partial [Acidimicrobiia bacterium]|nr:ImmA/IrrE family metallo-endopeptidase [Acidimicrobiia bacterium]